MEQDDNRILGEFVLVDDGSQITYMKLMEFISKSRISIVFKQNLVRQGLIQARNIGADIAAYPVLLFCDAHVLLEPMSIEPLIRV